MSFTDVWDANPQDGNWNNPNNWSTGTVPNGSQDGGAFCAASSITALTIEYLWFPPPIEIEAGAPAYSFNLTGSFTDAYSIGNDSSNVLSISLTSAPLAILQLSGAIFGAVSFTTDSNSQLDFEDYNYSSQTDNGVIITTNGLVYFTGLGRIGNGDATAGSAQLITNAGGVVDFSGSTGEAGDYQVSAGSIEGAGTYDLGSNQLTVGSEGLSTEVSGSINDGGAYGGSGASLVMEAGTNKRSTTVGPRMETVKTDFMFYRPLGNSDSFGNSQAVPRD